ncbi:MAG TPA: vWA domain-containing protein [Bacteroidia bacterium]|nr:vWA domain-containing protein [Bacteroidia bacterium]
MIPRKVIFSKLWKTVLFSCILLFFSVNAGVTSRSRGSIDLVFCIDLSASTNGLIDDVREKIWDIVNQVGAYRPSPSFRIGVIGFARPSFGEENAYVKILFPLSDDYDALENELYKLKPMVEKGDQYVGEALKVAVKKMDWVTDPDAMRVICIAGNGLVTTGNSESFRNACDEAVKRDIVINTMYCRTRNNAERDLPGWMEIARITGGQQFDIKIHKRTPLVLTSPDPARLKVLASNLNNTYIFYGKNGAFRYRMMVANDKRAYDASMMSFESRLYHKISDRFQFHQQGWDVIDYIKISNSDLEENFSMEEMNDSLKFKTPAYVRELAVRLKQDRNRIISELRKHLPYDRLNTINKKLEDSDLDKSDAFERTTMQALNKTAIAKGFVPASAGQDNLY